MHQAKHNLTFTCQEYPDFWLSATISPPYGPNMTLDSSPSLEKTPRPAPTILDVLISRQSGTVWSALSGAPSGTCS
ncbi:hypothetical protein DPMN_151729 [Dreissena polymorpha]|uniref:Uncharacterized protein n=1 Tax=Dreissena polymorpha TaxID=45954 RepID=A0A9D4J6S4_DREPO|nr:hypothetical protein DPMN_151729 [Dreissena polymorpha]